MSIDLRPFLEQVRKNKISDHVEDVTYSVVIAAKHKHTDKGPFIILNWLDLPYELFCKYQWYFKYRHAMVQVAFPKAIINFYANKEDKPERTIWWQQVERAKKSLSAAKGQVTKFESQLNEAKENWTEVFPIEDHPRWAKIMTKLSQKRINFNARRVEYEEALKWAQQQDERMGV